MFKRFFSSASSSGVLMIGCVALSIVLANTSAGVAQHKLLSVGLPWINDGLMSIFFLLVGLEIKRELVEGSLSNRKAATLPVLCALGGAVVPAAIYFTINGGLPTQAGWGIPMATDIAFALAILGMLGKYVPSSLKVFLAALAIADDLLAILVIAIFYAGQLHWVYLGYAAVLCLLLFLFNRMKLTNLAWYLAAGAALWYCIHHSGVHATIAGVITAMFIPMQPLKQLEHWLAAPVNLIIVPLFAFANTNILFENGMIAGLGSPAGLGIILGLVAGKPAGVLVTAFFATRSGLGQLPAQAGWRHMAGLGVLAGIGFTMSIFMTLLSFTEPSLIATGKFSVLCASLFSATIGYCLLRSAAKR